MIDEAATSNQAAETPVQFQLKCFEIRNGVKGSMDCVGFGCRPEDTSCPIDLHLIEEKIFAADTNGLTNSLLGTC